LLKKGSKSVGDSELEEKMDNVITVFQYIEDKDVFQKYYSRMLSRRLVYSNSMSMEVEENMVQKLKHVCGYQYTARLQRMLMDITLSSNLVMEFNDFLKLQSYSDGVIGFSSLILQSGAWQLTRSPCSTLVLPEEVTSLMTKFEAFYNSRHHGRCLSWLHHFSTGELKILYLKKPYIVTMTTFQMIVMMSFDDEDKPLPLSSLQLKCQLESRELKMTLQSLTDARLLIEHKSEDKTSDDEYSLNLHYSNKRTKFKISSSLQRETQQDIEQTQQMVLEDRKIFIQAAIVRVMKHRKTLKHNQLIEQTILLIRHRFNPNILLIKKCIESLIDKQYIERSPETKDMYHYVA
jgi:cullin 2